MHFLIGLGILAGLVWFAFSAGAARVLVGIVLLAIVVIFVVAVIDTDHEQTKWQESVREREAAALAANDAKAAAAAEVDRKAKEAQDAAAAYSATFFANLETARKRPLDRASWVPFCRDFTSRGWDSFGLGVNLNYAFAGGDNSTAVSAAFVTKGVCEMAASEALTQKVGGVASTMVVSCLSFNDAARKNAIKADATGVADPNVYLATVSVFCKAVSRGIGKAWGYRQEADYVGAVRECMEKHNWDRDAQTECDK